MFPESPCLPEEDLPSPLVVARGGPLLPRRCNLKSPPLTVVPGPQARRKDAAP